MVRFIALLSVVVGLTLLLACANLANLLLARASVRVKEFSVRLAIGASRARLIAQLLTESLCLSLLGAVAGLFFAVVLLRVLAGYQLPGGIAIGAIEVGLNLRVLGFTLLLSLMTAALFGLAPALQSTHPDLSQSLNQGGRQSGVAATGRLRLALVAAQVALCLVLLVGSGLFLQTLRNALVFDLGFPSGGLTLARFNLASLHYADGRSDVLIDELSRGLEAVPGVAAVGFGTRAPLLAGGSATMLRGVIGYEPSPDEELRLEYARISPGYLKALEVPLLAGRTFTHRDAATNSVVINEEMASRWWPGRSALGGRIELGDQTFQVVGIVGNTPWDDGLLTERYPFAFFSLARRPGAAGSQPLTLLVRSNVEAVSIQTQVREQIQQVDPNIVLSLLSSMVQQQETALMPQRMGTVLLGAFASLSLVLALVGIYGVVSYAVQQRTHEIGVRLAFGARQGHVRLLILSGLLGPLLAGISIGLLAVAALGRGVESLLFEVAPTDLRILGLAVALLLATSLVAGFFPARRAARIDPAKTLAAG